jgi:putative aldouronate transport system substrate-binding protein
MCVSILPPLLIVRLREGFAFWCDCHNVGMNWSAVQCNWGIGDRDMRRIASIAFLASILFLLGATNCALAEVPSEPIFFSVLYNQSEDVPFDEEWLILEEYANRRNVVLEIQAGDDSDYLADVIRSLETGNPPDVILKVWPNEIVSYAGSGVLLAFSDYEDMMPYFQSYIAEHDLAREIDKLRLENGKYYILPGYQREIQVQQWIYRKDLFEAHHLGAPSTYEDLLAALINLKSIYPNSTPLTACWGGAHLFSMMGAGYAIPAGWSGTRDYDPVEDQWQFAPATDAYRQLYTYLNRCYRAGVLDPEVLTQADSEYYAKILDGRALVTVSWISSGFSSWNETLQGNGFPDGEWAPLPVPESTLGIRALPAVDPFRKGLIVPSRVVNEPYFEDLLRFLDWAVYSEEGMTLTSWGVEGITFENTAHGKAFLSHIRATSNPEGTFDITDEYGLATLFDLNENDEFEDGKKPSAIVEFLGKSLAEGETASMDPILELGVIALEAIDTISGSIIEYAAAASHDFITGALDISMDWDGYIQELGHRGYRTLETIWNTAWAEQTRAGR